MATKKSSSTRKKSSRRKYGEAASKSVETRLHREKRGNPPFRQGRQRRQKVTPAASRPSPSAFQKPAKKALRFRRRRPAEKMTGFHAAGGWTSRSRLEKAALAVVRDECEGAA